MDILRNKTNDITMKCCMFISNRCSSSFKALLCHSVASHIFRTVCSQQPYLWIAQ